MNCHTVRELLAVIRPDSGDAVQPELASEMMHLDQCAECRTFFETQQRTDRELGRALREVAVPVDLKSRLLAQLAASTAVPASPAVAPVATLAPLPLSTDQNTPQSTVQTTVRPRATHRSWNRRQLLTIAGALLVAVIGGWWFLHLNRRPTQSVDELLALCHQPFPNGAAPFQKSFRPELPTSEIRVPALSGATRVLSLQCQKREVGAAVSYALRLAGGKSVPVMLVVIDLKRVQVPNLNAIPTSFRAASVYYPPPKSYATRVWHVGESLYVCYVISPDPDALGLLKNQSATT